MGLKRVTRQRTPASAPCPHCGRAFARNDSLIRHLKTHTSHIEERPFHRIINEKFRACDHCRRSKIRCTGDTPCARCEVLHKNCSYEHKNTTGQGSSSPPPGSGQESITLMSTASPASSPRGEAPDLDAPNQLLLDISAGAEAEDQVPKPTNNVVVSSPESTRSLLPLVSVNDEDHQTSFFAFNKDFALTKSTCVSPTFHILDPYSYKLPSIADSRERSTPRAQPLGNCNYPVLQYLDPFIDVDFGSKLACDLLDTYFSSAFSSRMHPTCHHVHNFILRKSDVLDPLHPRKTHPALLASMLFVAALSDKALGLFNGPEERDRVCKYLSLVTYRLLNPSRYEPLLSQEDLGLPPAVESASGWTNEDLRRALLSQNHSDSFPISWPTDYIIALIHVSSVISGSEKKAASIRWWNVAFNLARDLKLNQEVEIFNPYPASVNHTFNCQCTVSPEVGSDSISEVHREERRRTWWLLFLMDRHLALCYNRTLALLEAECRDLLLPLDDITWQNANQLHSHGIRASGPRCMLLPMGTGRMNGPPITCTGPGLFEFFLPLMTTTGHLLDYNRAKNNPILAATGSSIWSTQEGQILRQLDLYQASLDRLSGTMHLLHRRGSEKDSTWSTSPTALAEDSEGGHIARTVSAYAKHVLCVLRILISSKWDPLYLFDDSDLFTSSLSFKDSISHTMAASECVTQILEEDPDISFMPYFFGIQLLHGSLLLLLVAYRLQTDSGTAILTACEAVIRATEACFVTLPTDYQRQFRNVMRSAIGLAKGRRSDPADTEKQLTFVLARYRWSRNGAGLAR